MAEKLRSSLSGWWRIMEAHAKFAKIKTWKWWLLRLIEERAINGAKILEHRMQRFSQITEMF